MDAQVMDILRECTNGSDEERLTFPQVVAKLMSAGVERYHADLRRAEKTYYMPNGDSHVVPTAVVTGPTARDFSPDGIRDAVRAIQTGEIKYTQFCQRIAAAGCVDYTVSLVGRRATYSGRTGDSYVEPFLSAP